MTPNETKAWRALRAHHAEVKDVHLRELFAQDPGRAERFAVEGAGLFPLCHDASTNALIRRYRRLRAAR
jgi:hypothetical protein